MIRESHLPLWKIARGLGWDIVSTRRRFVRARVITKIPGRRDWLVSREWMSLNLQSVLSRIDELEDAGLLVSPHGRNQRGPDGKFNRLAPSSAV